MIKAYEALEKKLSGKPETKVEAKTETVTETQKTDTQKAETEKSEAQTETEAAKEVVANAGLDFQELSTEYWTNDGLSDESYAKLEKAGIPRQLVDQYAAGQRAIIDAQRNQVFTAVGGEEAYGDMINWARDNFSEKEIATFDKAVGSNDMDTVLLAVKGLQARYSGEATVEPSTTITGNRGGGGKSFASTAEMLQAMNDPRYSTDEAYIADVERRIANSPALWR